MGVVGILPTLQARCLRSINAAYIVRDGTVIRILTPSYGGFVWLAVRCQLLTANCRLSQPFAMIKCVACFVPTLSIT